MRQTAGSMNPAGSIPSTLPRRPRGAVVAPESRAIGVASSARGPGARPGLFLLWVAMAIAGAAHFALIWNHFYRGVPYLFDAGWYGALAHRNGPVLENPSAVVFGAIGERFYATHFSPGLWLLSLPSWLLPVSMPVWLGVLEGVKHAAIAGVVWLLVRELRTAGAAERRASDGAGAAWAAGAAGAALVLLAAFNGVLLACNVFPHFETWLVPLGLGFLLALHRGHMPAAWVCLAGAVSIREDMGFHLCGLLLVMAVLRGWRPWTAPREAETKRWLGFAAAGFAASVAALLIMRLGFPGDRAFARVYLGEPLFAHIDGEMLAGRLRLYWEERAYLWAPALVCGAWAAWRRSWWPLAGYLAFVPWALLHVLAASVYAGALASYYGFPYALALLWPLAGALYFARGERAGPTLGWAAALVLVSILAFARGNDLGAAVDRMRAPALGTREPIETVVRHLAEAVERSGPVVVCDAVAAQAPRLFDRTNLFHQAEGEPRIVAYYANGRQVKDARDHAGGLPHLHRVAGTSILVAAREALHWPGLVAERNDQTEAGR